MTGAGEPADGATRGEPHGVLVADKPRGPTSHDVVAKLRRSLGTRRVGHAGTLDPLATGVLVVLVGEATKLGAYLTAEDKAYVATVELGRATDTLDAAGRVVAEAPIPAPLDAELRRLLAGEAAGPLLGAALDAERRRTAQVPPAHSAIHVDGVRSYDRARRGETVELPPRPVAARAVELVAAEAVEGAAGPAWRLRFTLEVDKGYYVRSFARDLGDALGVPAHLHALRRTRSGGFGLESAIDPAASRAELVAALVPVEAAAVRALGRATLTADGVSRARFGQPLSPSDFSDDPGPEGAVRAWLDTEGRLVAVGARKGPTAVVLRGFSADKRN